MPEQKAAAIKSQKGLALSPNERMLLSLKAERDRYRLAILKVNAKVRLYTEKVRAEQRRHERVKLKGTPGHVVGARTKFLGHCSACVYRAAGWAGGSAHDPRRCKEAQKFLATAAGKRWLRKLKAQKAAKKAS